jgi:outer membrane protein TolC
MAQDKTWSLDECIRYALEHQPRQAQQKAQNEIYRLDRREALGAFFPSLNAGSGASMNFGRGLDPETNTYISTNTFSNAYEIYSSLTLFDGLAQYYRVKMANVRRLMGDEELRTLQDKTTFEVMELYFNVLYYKGTVDLADRQWSESAAHLRKYRRMEELGLTSIPDLAEAQAKEAEDRFLLTRQTNLYNLERIRLKEKMNLPADDDLLVDDYTPEPAVRPAPDSARTICQTALPALPAVQASAHALAAAELEYRIARGRLLPSLSMNAGFGTSFSRLMDGNDYMPFWEQLKVREGAYVGFTLSIPLFNGLARTSELQRSRQRAVIARSRHEEVRRQAYSEIEQAVADVDGLADEYRHAQQRTAAMQSAHQLNVRKYETGLIDALALATSANRLLNARVEELYTRLKYHLKYRLLTYYKTIDNPR